MGRGGNRNLPVGAPVVPGREPLEKRFRRAVRGIDPEMLKPRPIRGGKGDAQRIRTIKGFFESLPDDLILPQDVTQEVPFNSVINQKQQIFNYVVADQRTFFIEDMHFFARPAFGVGLVAPGAVEGALQCYFKIGEVVPVGVETQRSQVGVAAVNEAYFPFLNDRVGNDETTFAVWAKHGQGVEAYYINAAPIPVPLATVGVRVRGWLCDSNIIEEILENQR